MSHHRHPLISTLKTANLAESRTKQGRKQLSGPLVILDWEVKDLTPAQLAGIPTRLAELSGALRTQAWMIFTTKPMAQEFYSLGHAEGVEVADGIIAEDDGLLRLSAAKWIAADKVKIAKPENYGLTGLLETREENPVKTALLVGITLAFEPGRSLTKPRAA